LFWRIELQCPAFASVAAAAQCLAGFFARHGARCFLNFILGGLKVRFNGFDGGALGVDRCHQQRTTTAIPITIATIKQRFARRACELRRLHLC